MSIFNEMHRSPEFNSWDEYDGLVNSLNRAIEQGFVKEIPPSSEMRHGWSEKWFVEESSGLVFRLLSPDPPARGEWSEVEFPERQAS
jgi:hypothetical protein